MIKRTLTLGLVVMALGAGFAACGGSGDDTSAPAAAQTSKAAGPAVSAQDNSFSPGTLKVRVGDTVTFTNDGGIDHTVTATSGAQFDSGSLAPGATFKFTAEKAGTVSYVCTFHPGMQGTIEVS
jgi:plastocyanin